MFGVKYPVISGGMVWVSGSKLAAAVSNAGGLGLIGAGSMHPETLEEHIEKCKKLTDKPFGVNVPMLYPELDKIIDIIIKSGVKIVFTSAGNPKKYTAMLKEHGITVVHVVSSVKFAKKAEEAGVDAIVAEGFEAGGHNGREETTTMCLIPAVADAVNIPVIAAGGIADGRAMYAAMSLGADAVQVGSRFAITEESSAHDLFKKAVIDAQDGDTKLTLKELAPVRLLQNSFFQEVQEAYQKGADKDELRALLGRGRAKKGIFEGDLDNGELEIGQVSAMINEVKPVSEVMEQFVAEYTSTHQAMSKLPLL